PLAVDAFHLHHDLHLWDDVDAELGSLLGVLDETTGERDVRAKDAVDVYQRLRSDVVSNRYFLSRCDSFGCRLSVGERRLQLEQAVVDSRVQLERRRVPVGEDFESTVAGGAVGHA